MVKKIIGLKKILFPKNPPKPGFVFFHPKTMEVLLNGAFKQKHVFSMVKIRRIIQLIANHHIHPRRLTAWTWKWWFGRSSFFFQGCILRFHDNLPGCISMDVTQVDRPLHWLNFVKFLAFIRNPVENAPFPATNMIPIPSKYPNFPTWHRFPQDWFELCGQLPKDTPPKTNMEPENRPLEKEIPIGNQNFQVVCWISGVYQKDSGRNYWELSSGIPFPRSFAESENTWKYRWWKKSKQPTWDL